MPNPYESAIAGDGAAPRLEVGWAALVERLSQGPCSRRDCLAAVTATGLAEKTASNMLTQAIRLGYLRRSEVRYDLVALVSDGSEPQ